jgi:hypothetical protein
VLTYSPSHGLYVSQGNDKLYMPAAFRISFKSHSETYSNYVRLTLGLTLPRFRTDKYTDKSDDYVNRKMCVYSY